MTSSEILFLQRTQSECFIISSKEEMVIKRIAVKNNQGISIHFIFSLIMFQYNGEGIKNVTQKTVNNFYKLTKISFSRYTYMNGKNTII